MPGRKDNNSSEPPSAGTSDERHGRVHDKSARAGLHTGLLARLRARFQTWLHARFRARLPTWLHSQLQSHLYARLHLRLVRLWGVVQLWLDHEPNRRLAFLRNAVVSITLAIVCTWAMSQTALFKFSSNPLTPDDLNLSGTWKYKIADDPAFANPSLDDSTWCLISVPDAGNPPIAGPNDHPAADCPTKRYPVEALRDHTYWYRTQFEVPAQLLAKWKDPALFLGAIKDRGWVYLDGQFIGGTFLLANPHIFPLDKVRLSPGRHYLSIRAATARSENPGIFHAYPRLVSVGELDRQSLEITRLKGGQQEQAVVGVVQLVSLLLLAFFVLRSGGAGNNFFWLMLYFGFGSLISAAPLITGNLQRFIEDLARIVMSAGLVGFGHEVLLSESRIRNRANRLLQIVTLCFCLLHILDPPLLMNRLAVEVSLVYVLLQVTVKTALPFFVHRPKKGQSAPSISGTDLLTLATLLTLHLIYFWEGVIYGNHAVFFHLPFWTALLTVIVVALSAEDYIRKLNLLIFFGRFIRPGLRQLLSDYRHQYDDDQEWIRGKRVVAIKLDIVGFTNSTYSLPYGIKRLFQNLWYTYTDRVMEHIAFFSMPEGDGSVYFLDEKVKEGGCGAAIAAAHTILGRIVPEFDQEFKSSLKRLLQTAPELAQPFTHFVERHKNLTGRDFWNEETQVRFVFHYGWVDEGLWGLRSQSHYGVAGDLLIEIARLEKLAPAKHFLVTRPFCGKWKSEKQNLAANYRFNWQNAELKGIGSYDYALLSPIEKYRGQKTA